MPKTPAIARRIAALKAKIDKLYKEIAELRASCPHPNMRYKYGSNTGNWDRGDDCYWTDTKCVVCGLTQHLEGSVTMPVASVRVSGKEQL